MRPPPVPGYSPRSPWRTCRSRIRRSKKSSVSPSPAAWRRGNDPPVRGVDPQRLARRPPVPRVDRALAPVGGDRAGHRAGHLVGDRGSGTDRRIHARRLRPLLLRRHAHQPADDRLGFRVSGPLDPRRRSQLPARPAARSRTRGGGGEYRLQGAHRERHPRGLARRRRGVARGAPAVRARPLGDHGRRGAARRRDAVLHQLHHGIAGVLDDTRHRDHGAPCGRVPVPRRSDRAAGVAAACRSRRRGGAVVPLHARLPSGPPHRRGTRDGRDRARARSAGGVARAMGRCISPGLDPWLASLRGDRRLTLTMTFRIPHSAFRILSAFWRLNLAEELQYRANFVASVLGTVFNMATALLTLALFFHHTTALGGWDYWQIVVLLGVFNALTGVVEAVLRPGIGQLAGEVRGGGLDLVLVKPR